MKFHASRILLATGLWGSCLGLLSTAAIGQTIANVDMFKKIMGNNNSMNFTLEISGADFTSDENMRVALCPAAKVENLKVLSTSDKLIEMEFSAPPEYKLSGVSLSYSDGSVISFDLGDTNRPVYTLRGVVVYVAGYSNREYLTKASDWCTIDPGKNRVKGGIIIGHGGLMFMSTGSKPSGCDLYIPYDEIVGLSRGNIPTPGIGPVVTATTGLGSLLAGVLKSTVTKTGANGQSTTTVSGRSLAITIGLASVAALSGFISYQHAKNANYLAISFDESSKDSKPRGGCEVENDISGQVSQAGAKTPPPFYKGNLVIFRLTNRNDYWDTSMILTSATGCEFVSEEAEKK